jgi:hypothetical protein
LLTDRIYPAKDGGYPSQEKFYPSQYRSYPVKDFFYPSQDFRETLNNFPQSGRFFLETGRRGENPLPVCRYSLQDADDSVKIFPSPERDVVALRHERALQDAPERLRARGAQHNKKSACR